MTRMPESITIEFRTRSIGIGSLLVEQHRQSLGGNDKSVDLASQEQSRATCCTSSKEKVVLKVQAEDDKDRRKQIKQEQLDREIARHLQFMEDMLRSNRPPSREEILQSLETCQRRAVEHVENKAMSMHFVALPLLEERVKSFGFSPTDMKNCLHYIRDDVPIIIHLRKSTLKELNKDTHYRNLFETKTSGGCRDEATRRKWETAMFGKCYSSAECKAFDRPKYGCLNFTGDYSGVMGARSYGEFFVILRQHVRHRATFFSMDTGNATVERTLATNQFYSHILLMYNDEELKSILQVANSHRIRGAPSKCTKGDYKEVQIHGPICLETDIETLSCPGRKREASKSLRDEVAAFQVKTKCNVLWQQDLLDQKNDNDYGMKKKSAWTVLRRPVRRWFNRQRCSQTHNANRATRFFRMRKADPSGA